MAEDAKTGLRYRSASEFLAALERSGAFSDAQWRELQDRFAQRSDLDDALSVARQLVKEGTLSEFQARRLLKGKKSLVFGRYLLIDHIGQGARGQVFKARHRLMDRVVALKVFLPDALSKTAVSRFFREMKLVALLDHPNVVRAIDADLHDGFPYIVMEYLEGQDLEQVFARRGPLPMNDVLEYMAQACRGLDHAHEKGVIHRDVKPTNLFLLSSGVVKVLDLGLGELVGQAQQTAKVFDTDEGVVVGTTDYMSPEQIKDKPADRRTDLFGLGCTMYRLLTGTFAFPGLTREDRLVKRIREGHVPIKDVRPELPAVLARIVDRLLALRPDDRFGSAVEAAEAMEALLPSSIRRGRGSTPGAGKRPGTGVADVHSDADEPLDWSMIESALRPTGPAAREAPRLVDRQEPRPPSARSLSTHRKQLEEEGIESGREVHEQYRHELIQMNKVMSELRSMDPKDEDAATNGTWLERLGEKVGDNLAEPSAGLILIGILLLILILAIAVGFSIS